MKSIRYIPIAAAVLGILGAVLRGMNLSSGYEPSTNLPIPGNKPQIALVVLSIVVFLAMLLWSTLLRTRRGTSFEDAFGCTSPLYKMIAVLSALIMGFSGLGGLYLLANGELLSGKTLFSNLPLIPLWVLALLTTFSFITVASGQSRGHISEGHAIFTIVPMFWACFDLIITFKDNGASPFVSLYAFELFAAIALVYSFYAMSAFLYSTSNPARFVCMSTLAVFFCFTCVGGYLVCALLGGSTITLTPEAMLRYACFGGSSVYLLSNLYIVTRNLTYQSQH